MDQVKVLMVYQSNCRIYLIGNTPSELMDGSFLCSTDRYPRKEEIETTFF